MARGPVFLEHRPYRRRRLRDAVRLLPFLGLALVILPTLWPAGDGAGRLAIRTTVLFLGWAFLIVLAAVLSKALSVSSPSDEG